MDVNKRNFTEFGNMLLFDTSDEEYDGSNKKAIKLPGSKHTDLGERRGKIAVEVQDVAFCPTGKLFSGGRPINSESNRIGWRFASLGYLMIFRNISSS